MKYIEEDMIAAIEDVQNGMSVRGAAKKHKVSKTTLCNRLNSKGEVQVVGRPTFLPSDEELVLVNWGIHFRFHLTCISGKLPETEIGYKCIDCEKSPS